MDNKVIFYVINEEGLREEAQILAKYKLSDTDNYITYTYNEINDNNMVKIYTTGVIYENGNYSYKEITSDEEWNKIKDVMKDIAKDEDEPINEAYNCDLKFKDEEVSVRRPKKLLVSKKFADTLALKYSEEDSSKINSLSNVNVEAALNTPAEFILNQESEKEDLLSKTIEIPTFEELQARNKNIENVITNFKPENKTDSVASLEEFKVPEESSNDQLQMSTPKKNYKDKFREEVEPILMNAYENQLKKIDDLEEELSKTKYDLFEKQKEALSLKKANEQLESESNILKEELSDVQEKMNGILNVIQGNNKD